jgi:hypothetical protein
MAKVASLSPIPPPGGEGVAAQPRREGGKSYDDSKTCPLP